MKVKIKHLKFQRNGVAGEPFYHCLFDLTEDGVKREMIAVFTTNGGDNQIDKCKVVCYAEIDEAWRGDRIGGYLQTEFNKMMRKNGGTFYDNRPQLRAKTTAK